MAEYSESEQRPDKTMAKTDPNKELGQKLLKRANTAFESQERVNVESQWAELAEFILPSQSGKFFKNQDKGANRLRRVFDSTAINACRDLSASAHSIITNPATKWSKLRFRETELNNLSVGIKWLTDANAELHYALNDSNFDNQIGRMYQSWTGLATGVLLHDEIHKDGVFDKMNFAAWHVGEVAYMENSQGMVDCIYRKFTWTVKQAYEKFDDALPKEYIDQLKSAPESEIEICHCIYKRPESEVKEGLTKPEYRPVASDYIECKNGNMLKREGYYTFPVYVPRWMTLPGEIYGIGPGHIARADILVLNAINRQLLKSLAKAVDPVILTQSNNILSGDFRPGKRVNVNDINGIKEFVTQSRFDIGFMQAKELRDNIKAAFYIDKLLLPPRTETGEMTAYEIQERLAQNQIILGPPLSRLNTELLQPLVERCLDILIRAGKIAPIPEEVKQASKNYVKGQKDTVIEYDVSFVNSLARSQQTAEARAVLAWVNEVGGMAQVLPAALDRVNADAVAEGLGRLHDVPEEYIRDDKEVEKMQQDKQKQQEAAMALQAADVGSNAVKNLSSTNKSIQ